MKICRKTSKITLFLIEYKTNTAYGIPLGISISGINLHITNHPPPFMGGAGGGSFTPALPTFRASRSLPYARCCSYRQQRGRLAYE